MKCKSCGYELIEDARFCPQCGTPIENQEVKEEIINDTQEVKDEPIELVDAEDEVVKDWYYVSNQNDRVGPFSEQEMIEFIRNKIIYGNTYVWKSGLADWIRLKDSILASYLFQDKSKYEQPVQNTVQGNLLIASRSIAMDVLLSIVTCGLYYYYWLYVIARNINTVEQSKGVMSSTSPGMVVLLSIVTCNIYTLFFYWKAGKTLAGLTTRNGYRIDDDSFVLVLLSFLGLSIVSNAILENNFNDIEL